MFRVGLTRKDMALSAISMNSALVDKEFVLSLHHKLHVHVLKWVNVSTNRMMYTNTITQLFTQSINHHKQQWNLPPWWNYLQVFIQRRSLIRQNRIRQLPFKLRPLTAHIRMAGTYRAWLFENRIDLEIIEIRFIYQTPIMFKAARTGRDHTERPRSPIGAFVFTCRFKCMENRQVLINFKLFVGPDLGPNFLLMLSAEARW